MHTLANVRLQVIDFDIIRYDFLKYIGSQIHVQCEEHNRTLISSTKKSNRFKYDRNIILVAVNLNVKFFYAEYASNKRMPRFQL